VSAKDITPPPTTRRGPLDGHTVLALQRSAGNASVARMLEEREDSGDRPSLVHQVVGGGGGRPLDTPIQTLMESRLGADFSNVRLHTDAIAAASAREVNARAYTAGDDVVFGAGQYQPGSTSGLQTLAHELTHVVQQRAGAVDGAPTPGGIRLSDPSDRFERAAEASAARVVSGGDMPAAGAVQRDAEELESVQALAVQRQEDEEPEESDEED
jgi:hypothetical protein